MRLRQMPHEGSNTTRMTLFSRKRGWVATTALLLTVSLGALAGYLLGRREVLRTAQVQLTRDAANMDATLSSLVVESQYLMASINASKYQACSDKELAWLRRLIYYAKDIRDAGRMSDGRMQCSAVFGRENLPTEQFQPQGINLDGTRFYIDLPLHTIPGVPVYSRQRGNAFVVEDPNFSIRFNALRKNHAFASLASPRQANGYPQGFTPRVAGVVADRDAQGRLGDTLYATRCSPHSLDCVISYGSAVASLSNAKRQLVMDAALGGFSGGFLALAVLLIYQRSLSMRSQLRRAIRRGKLCLVYQPIVELTSGRIVQAEALARWTDEEGFAVSPLVFVPIAEAQGFVGELTAFVVRQALHELGNLLRSEGDFQVSVNITAFDMKDSNLPSMLERALDEAGVAPERLAIELTESATANTQVAIATIRQLRQRGHRIEIDDFGTGYSSLAYLKDLSVDSIKIDKAFTQAISTEAVIGEILPQILSMADALGLQVIAEGIETLEQAAFFSTRARPVLGQGWYFGRPVPAAEFQRNFIEQATRLAKSAEE